MSTHDHSSEQGRLFRTLVLMGGSLALGCGGTAVEEATHDATGAAPGAGSTSGSATTGGSTAVGGVTSTGGQASTGGVTFTGGSTSVGGTWPGGATSTGGTAGAPTFVRPPEFPCPYEQVDCGGCSYSFDVFVLPSYASCHSDWPVSAADCAPGERFFCLEAEIDENGGRFATGVPCGCQCVPAEYECQQICGNELTSTCRELPSPNAPAGTLESLLCSGCFASPILK